MELPVCWLFFDAVLIPGDPAVFAGHCHDPDYIGDCPVDGYLVGCDVCLVDVQVHTLTYDTNITPPDQSGVIITPTNPLRMMLTTEPILQSGNSEPTESKNSQKKRGGRRGKATPTRRSSEELGGESVLIDVPEQKYA